MKKVAMTSIALVLGLAALAVVVPALGGAGPVSPELQQVRAAVAKYHSVAQAEKDGYTIAGEPCVALPSGETMGVHAVDPALLADPAIDPLQPEILLYVPKENGKLELVGVEYWRADADQNLDTAGDRPSLFGQPFDGPMSGHAPGMPIHYDLHVWVAEANPSGVFAMFNPALSCS